MRAPPASAPQRPARDRSPVLGWALVLTCVGLLGTGLLADGRAQAQSAAGADVTRGATVYAANCTACHGSTGAGVPGDDRTAGPALRHVDAAYVELTLRTGRMPLRAPEVGVVPPPDGLPADDRAALVAWMVAELGIPDSRPVAPSDGEVARGHELYSRHCAQCHGATGAGGVAADGTLIRPVVGVDAVATAQAIRMGPFTMPAFAEGQIPDEEVGDIAAFVATLDQRAATPLGLEEIDRVAMALLVLVVVGATFGIVLLLSHPVDLIRRGDAGPAEAHK